MIFYRCKQFYLRVVGDEKVFLERWVSLMNTRLFLDSVQKSLKEPRLELVSNLSEVKLSENFTDLGI